MDSFIIKEYIKEKAKKYGISEEQLRDMLRSEFEYVSYLIETSDPEETRFEGVFLKKLGTFGVTELRKRKVRSRQEREEREKKEKDNLNAQPHENTN